MKDSSFETTHFSFRDNTKTVYMSRADRTPPDKGTRIRVVLWLFRSEFSHRLRWVTLRGLINSFDMKSKADQESLWPKTNPSPHPWCGARPTPDAFWVTRYLMPQIPFFLAQRERFRYLFYILEGLTSETFFCDKASIKTNLVLVVTFLGRQLSRYLPRYKKHTFIHNLLWDTPKSTWTFQPRSRGLSSPPSPFTRKSSKAPPPPKRNTGPGVHPDCFPSVTPPPLSAAKDTFGW